MTTQSHRELPREHHYFFAHSTVRDFCSYDPMQFFALMASPEKEKLIAWLWQATEKMVGKPITEFDPKQVIVTRGQVKRSPAVFLKMPPPVVASEAYLVGVLLTDLQATAEGGGKAAHRYFTLEHGVRLDGTERTVLCEWAKSGHINYGDGPAPTVEEFAKAVEGII